MKSATKPVPHFALPPRHVAVATDLSKGSRDAEIAAIQIAKRFGAKLTFVSIDPTFIYHAELLARSGGLASPSFDPERQARYLARRADELRAHVLPLAEGFPFEVLCESGDPSLSLLAWLQSSDVPVADLLVLGRKKRGPLESFFLGSTATNVLEEARIPVVMVPENSLSPGVFSARDVVLATDLVTTDLRPSEAAAAFARAWEGGVTLVHAFEAQDYRPLPPEFLASEDLYHELTSLILNATKVKKEHLVRDAHALKARTGVPTEAKLLEGEAKETLLAYVKKANASLLVLGRFTRTGGLGAWFLGSTARTLAMHASCPVLIVPHD
jgi:nucleotide-binding universal stress UspA family protein